MEILAVGGALPEPGKVPDYASVESMVIEKHDAGFRSLASKQRALERVEEDLFSARRAVRKNWSQKAATRARDLSKSARSLRKEVATAEVSIAESFRADLSKTIGGNATGRIHGEWVGAVDARVRAEAGKGLSWISDISTRQLPAETLKINQLPPLGRAYMEGPSMFLTETGGGRTVVHEFGHFWETFDGSMKSRTQQYLERRTRRESLRRMNDLVPDGGFEFNELTKPDKFFEPYVGKHMNGTEVLSMGLEHLYAEPWRLWNEDRDLFRFIIETLQGAE